MEKRIFELLKRTEKGLQISREDACLLRELGYVDTDGFISQTGLDKLEPYRVKRAVIMAAGFGSRMAPLTLTTPKPMVDVNGVRFIDTLIQKLIKAGITDITIIRGYLKERFDELLSDYPFVKFIDNDRYASENNISSAVLAADLLKDAYLCEGDFFITGDSVIEKYQYESNYLCSKADETDDWCFDVDTSGNAYNYRKGGQNCFQAYGISYWNAKDGAMLGQKLNDMYKDINNRQEFWEMCIFQDQRGNFDVKARAIERGEIIEVDSLDELQALRISLA